MSKKIKYVVFNFDDYHILSMTPDDKVILKCHNYIKQFILGEE